MKSLKTKVIVILATFALSNIASANDDIWFGVKAGTVGVGAEASWRPIEWLDVRADANFYDYEDSGSQAGVNYAATLALETFYLTGNFRFPLSPFRLTAEAFTNNNELTLASQELLNEVEDLKAYPVISIGFNFNF